MISHLYLSPVLAHCNFDKTPTLPIVMFEVFILAGVAGAFLILPKIKDKVLVRFLVMAAGVLLFEMFTAPMWNNHKMGWWAYVYHDVSWILTLGWTALILGVVLLVDKFLESWKEWKKFGVYLGVLTLAVVPFEMIAVNTGIRSYAPEVREAVSGIFILGVPVEILYYVPVFGGLVITFYKYWSFLIDGELIAPLKPLARRKWLRSLLITFLGVFLFEVMIEPMVRNEKLPQWSYIFHDISILMTGMWILAIGLTAIVVTRFFIHYPMIQRFFIATAIAGAVAWPVESWLIVSGYRVYGPSAVNNFTGFVTPVTGVPVEVAFAIPCYMALIIAFIRYWEIILDNRL
ncbi:MAG: hypothetical protein KME26_24175 [Oscillatoria princeps RMCB-10]|jgi:hypothetical protein|nr:hypothetical protein [Oscillatoria princeps RMCB-10]